MPFLNSFLPYEFLQLKTKVQMLRNTRDYSFLLSDDAELPVPPKGSLPHKAAVANSGVFSVVADLIIYFSGSGCNLFIQKTYYIFFLLYE